jgi:hypothetical protein
LLSQKFEKYKSAERGDDRNSEVRLSENVANRPEKSLGSPHAGALEFSHEQIGVKKENDKANLDQRSAKISFHRQTSWDSADESAVMFFSFPLGRY